MWTLVKKGEQRNNSINNGEILVGEQVIEGGNILIENIL